jgi:uncharacterized membrane protein
MTESENNPNARLEFFCDGVFAIAITLLVIEIKVPHPDHIHSTGDLVHALWQLWPSYFAFLFSFGAVLVSWVNHHYTMSLIDKTSRAFMYGSGLFLMSVIFIPFPTALLAEYISTPYAQPAITFYCFFNVFNNIAWHVLYFSARHPHKLYKDNVADTWLDRNSKAIAFGFVIYLATAILSFWFPYTAFGFSLMLWTLWIGISLSAKMELDGSTVTN